MCIRDSSTSASAAASAAVSAAVSASPLTARSCYYVVWGERCPNPAEFGDFCAAHCTKKRWRKHVSEPEAGRDERRALDVSGHRAGLEPNPEAAVEEETAARTNAAELEDEPERKSTRLGLFPTGSEQKDEEKVEEVVTHVHAPEVIDLTMCDD